MNQESENYDGQKEALKEMKEAIQLHLRALAEDGIPAVATRLK
jgi:predicted RNase H-like HicB family nuclease